MTILNTGGMSHVVYAYEVMSMSKLSVIKNPGQNLLKLIFFINYNNTVGHIRVCVGIQSSNIITLPHHNVTPTNHC